MFEAFLNSPRDPHQQSNLTAQDQPPSSETQDKDHENQHMPSPAAQQNATQSPPRPYRFHAPGAARPVVQQDGWEMRFNSLFNRWPIQTETRSGADLMHCEEKEDGTEFEDDHNADFFVGDRVGLQSDTELADKTIGFNAEAAYVLESMTVEANHSFQEPTPEFEPSSTLGLLRMPPVRPRPGQTLLEKQRHLIQKRTVEQTAWLEGLKAGNLDISKSSMPRKGPIHQAPAQVKPGELEDGPLDLTTKSTFRFTPEQLEVSPLESRTYNSMAC